MFKTEPGSVFGGKDVDFLKKMDYSIINLRYVMTNKSRGKVYAPQIRRETDSGESTLY